MPQADGSILCVCMGVGGDASRPAAAWALSHVAFTLRTLVDVASACRALRAARYACCWMAVGADRPLGLPSQTRQTTERDPCAIMTESTRNLNGVLGCEFGVVST